jgi:hypothetical protein
MPTYQNGYIPRELLTIIGSGTDNYGRYEWLLSPGTAAKHYALVERAHRRTRKWLSPSPGWSCYRPYAWQVKYRAEWGNGAAWPGTSSHGGLWEGRQTLAIDYGNWDEVYRGVGGNSAFYEDVRAVGLSPGLIAPPNYPYEPWHVVDLDPWAPAFASGGSTPFPGEEPTKPEGSKMTIYVRRDDGLVVAIPEGGPVYNFPSQEEYDATRNIIAFVNGQRQKHGQPLVTLPPTTAELVDEATMNAANVNRLIYSQGAASSAAPSVDVKALAAALIPLLPRPESAPEVNVEDIEDAVSRALGNLVLVTKVAQGA